MSSGEAFSTAKKRMQRVAGGEQLYGLGLEFRSVLLAWFLLQLVHLLAVDGPEI